MNHFKLILGLAFIVLIGDLKAQDYHFSNYRMLPLHVNPALAGAFQGTFRIGGVARGQWWGTAGGTPQSGDGYKTVSGFIDSPVIRGLKKTDWIGVGMDYFYDNAGFSDLTYTGGNLNIAYHLSLDKKQTSVLTIGVGPGSVTTNLNVDADYITRVDRSQLNYGTNPDLALAFQNAMQGKLSSSVGNWRVGALLTTAMGKTADLRLGASVSHLLKPNKGLLTGTTGATQQDQLKRKLSIFATIYSQVSDKMVFVPSLFVENQYGTTKILVQGQGNYLFNEDKDFWLNFGLGFRLASASDVILFLGSDYKDWSVGLSYDVNFGPLDSAMELGLTKVIKIYKKPKAAPVMICPRL